MWRLRQAQQLQAQAIAHVSCDKPDSDSEARRKQKRFQGGSYLISRRDVADTAIAVAPAAIQRSHHAESRPRPKHTRQAGRVQVDTTDMCDDGSIRRIVSCASSDTAV
jgi:hypothetical protein